MNIEIRDEWADALESGEYEQGFGRLNFDGKFCCLGVLSELLVKRGVLQRVGIGYAPPGGGPDQVVENFLHSTAGEYAGILNNRGQDVDLFVTKEDFNSFEYSSAVGNAPPRLGVEDARESDFVIRASSANDDFNLSFRDIAKLVRRL